MTTPLSHKRPTPLNTFYYGATYYPEHWTEADRRDDPARMAEAGMNCVRMAEFAWDLMEPRPGEYNFDLFDAEIERLGKQGIVTILGTPTAAPPRWFSAKYPEALRVDENDRRQAHGSRQQACYSSPILRRHSREITRAMAERFGSSEFVVGWQTDNEFNCNFSECYCASCVEAFREFLRERYGTVDELNRAWGAAFWAQTYDSFDDVGLPYRNRPTIHNPSHMLDYFRFLSWTVTRFQHDQVAILRELAPNQWVTHNGCFGHLQYRGPFTEDLDFLSMDIYPFFSKPDDRRAGQTFTLDRARAWSGNFIIPEQQSGPGGNSQFIHETPEPGENRRMVYTSIARGADGLLHFRWRSCRFGAEEYWCGVLDHDNAPRRRYDEVKQIGAELKRVGSEVLGTHVAVDVAIAGADQVALEAHDTYPMELPHPNKASRDIHKQLEEKHIAVGVAHPTDDLADIKVYVIPHLAWFDPAWVEPLERWVKGGGTLVVGARTATRTVDNHITGEVLPGVLRELCGVSVEEWGHIRFPEQRTYHLAIGSSHVEGASWYEALSVDSDDVTVIGRWTDRHLREQPAVTCRPVGQGHVIYVGTYLEAPVFGALWETIAKLSGVEPQWPDLPPAVEVVRRQSSEKTLWFFMNHADHPVVLPSPPKGRNLVTDEEANGDSLELEGYGVAAIKEG